MNSKNVSCQKNSCLKVTDGKGDQGLNCFIEKRFRYLSYLHSLNAIAHSAILGVCVIEIQDINGILLIKSDGSHFVFARCTMNTAHCALHTAHCALHTAHCTLHTAHCTLHTAHCTLHIPQTTLHTPHTTLHTTRPLIEKQPCFKSWKPSQ